MNRLVFDNIKADAQRIAFKAANLIKETLSSKQITTPSSEKLEDEDLEWCKDIFPQNSLQTKSRAVLHTWEIRKNSKDFIMWRTRLNTHSLLFDGAAKCNPGQVGAGGIIFDPGGKIEITYA